MPAIKVSESARASPSSPPGGDEEWDEARLEAAMAHLQEQHLQLRRLRSAIPSLIKPMHAAHGSAERVYADFSAAAHGAVQDIKTFAALMRDDESEAVRHRARASEAESREGVEDWLFTQHPDWCVRPVPVLTKDRPKKDPASEVVEIETGRKVGEGVEEDVKEFRETHPDVVLTLNASDKTIKFRAPPPFKMPFTVRWAEQVDPDKPVYVVTCEQKTRLGQDMARVLARRPHASNLQWTLEMLAAYGDVRTRKCAACGKLVDTRTQFPIVRERRAPTQAADEKKSTPATAAAAHYAALHEGCCTTLLP